MCADDSLGGASAHVLITDETKTKGAILHIIPDDDPVAGEESTLYFDTQDQLSDAKNAVKISIKDSSGNENVVGAKVDRTLATANYTFPEQGVYELAFTVTVNGKSYIFQQSQRVSRGVSNSALNSSTHGWAEISLITSGVGAALLIVVAINKRKDIAKHSTF